MGGLHSLGYDAVSHVRVGKYIEIRLDAGGLEEAEQAIAGMCDQLLANPVIEDFRFTLEPISD